MAPKSTTSKGVFDAACLDQLHENVSAIFNQVQTSIVNHKKNSVSLHRLHVQSSAIVQTLHDGVRQLTGERRFTNVFLDMLCRVLDTKRGFQEADRVVKFIGAYVAFILEKGECWD